VINWGGSELYKGVIAARKLHCVLFGYAQREKSMAFVVSLMVFLGFGVVLVIGVLSVLHDLLNRGPYLHSGPIGISAPHRNASSDLSAEWSAET
jgi:hypothetical protein